MNAPTKTKPAPGVLAELEELHKLAGAADRAAAATLAERDASSRWLAAAQTRLAALVVAEPRDPAAERAARDEITDLTAMLVPIDERGGHVRYADRRAADRHHDALDAAEDAKADISRFVIERRHDIEDELRDRSVRVADRLAAAVEELSAANSEWASTSRIWRGFLELWGAPPIEMPQMPLPGIAVQDIELVVMQVRGGARDPRGLVPMPSSLAPGAEHEERHTTPLRGWAHIPSNLSMRETEHPIDPPPPPRAQPQSREGAPFSFE